jgi:hypothetical protein
VATRASDAARRVCRQTLVRVVAHVVSDAMSRERQTWPGTLFQHMSLGRVECGAASCVKCVCRLRTGHVCRVSREQSSLDHVCRAYGRVCRSASDASIATVHDRWFSNEEDMWELREASDALCSVCCSSDRHVCRSRAEQRLFLKSYLYKYLLAGSRLSLLDI